MHTHNADRLFLLEAIFLGCLIVLLLVLSIRYTAHQRRMNADAVYSSIAPEYGPLRMPGGENHKFAAPAKRRMPNEDRKESTARNHSVRVRSR